MLLDLVLVPAVTRAVQALRLLRAQGCCPRHPQAPNWYLAKFFVSYSCGSPSSRSLSHHLRLRWSRHPISETHAGPPRRTAPE